MQEKEQCDSLPSRTMPSLAGPALAQCLQATPANAAVLLQLVHLMRHEQLQQGTLQCFKASKQSDKPAGFQLYRITAGAPPPACMHAAGLPKSLVTVAPWQSSVHNLGHGLLSGEGTPKCGLQCTSAQTHEWDPKIDMTNNLVNATLCQPTL
jgi:hypothetical protein